MERSTNIASGIAYGVEAVARHVWRGTVRQDPVPKAREGEIVIYYGGWTLPFLRRIRNGQLPMRQDQTWYDDKDWAAENGYYRLLLPVPESNRKTWSEQLAHLRTIDQAWQPAPVCVVATALVVHLAETGNDLLRNGWCRCAEARSGENRVVLTVIGGRVGVAYYWDDCRDDGLWLSSACRKC